jgi:homoserine acetyltransferase
MLWPEDMPAGKTLVVLSTHDDLVPVDLVSRQLEAATEAAGAPCARVLVHPTAGHGGFLVDVPFQVSFRASVVAAGCIWMVSSR